MSTRWNIQAYKTTGGLQTGLEGVEIPEDFEIPSCGIEDVDRAVFKLFNEDLPFWFESKGDMKRIPCIFAGGERAMLLRNRKGLRDPSGALILPLISILRNGIDQAAEKGFGPGQGGLVIKKRIAKEDREYKKIVNREGLQNQDGIIGTNDTQTNTSLGLSNNNVFEIISIPNPRFFKATYEVTFWAQYLTQMNDIVEAFITSYSLNTAKTFKIETDKGYWYVAHVESGLNDSNNLDSYTDDERLIKTSITLSVNGYIINPKFPGAPSTFRRYVSAPRVKFETSVGVTDTVLSSKIPSNRAEDYTYDDFNTENQPLPGSTVSSVDTDGPEFSVNIGGNIIDNGSNSSRTIRNLEKKLHLQAFGNETVSARVKSQNLAKGETVYTLIKSLNQE